MIYPTITATIAKSGTRAKLKASNQRYTEVHERVWVSPDLKSLCAMHRGRGGECGCGRISPGEKGIEREENGRATEGTKASHLSLMLLHRAVFTLSVPICTPDPDKAGSLSLSVSLESHGSLGFQGL